MGAAAHVLQLQESSAAQQIQAERQAGAERLALLDRLHQAAREGLRYREQVQSEVCREREEVREKLRACENHEAAKVAHAEIMSSERHEQPLAQIENKVLELERQRAKSESAASATP
eukprot:723123-Karenia_brevis.AAC.1